MKHYVLTTLALCLGVSAYAQCSYFVSAGPETYYFHRLRDGGTHQEGRIDGISVGIDRLKRYGIYIGGEYLYATGRLKGRTGRGSPLTSELTDEIYEIRLGFTLQQNKHGCPFFTPFGGWGFFREINDFKPPSPLPCKFTDTFNYIVAGFLSGVNLTPLLSMGVNFKLKFMQDGKSKVTDDPLFDDVTLMMKEEIQARVDVPFVFFPCHSWLGLGFQFSPFYEYRHFGGREGFPFNFRDTKFQLYGAKFTLMYRF